MNARADFDAVVAAALEQIEPRVAVGAEEILQRARAAAPSTRRRLRRRAIAIAVALALVLARAALAAQWFGLLSWLEVDEPGTAHFVIESRRAYAGPASRCAPRSWGSRPASSAVTSR